MKLDKSEGVWWIQGNIRNTCAVQIIPVVSAGIFVVFPDVFKIQPHLFVSEM